MKYLFLAALVAALAGCASQGSAVAPPANCPPQISAPGSASVSRCPL
jgi:hypothetical protein